MYKSVKSLAIIIRAHGEIPVSFTYGGMSDAELINSSIDVRQYGYDYVTTVTSANMGGVCYGSSNIPGYIRGLDCLHNQINEDMSRNGYIYSVDSAGDYVHYLYDTNNKIMEIRKLNDALFGNSYKPNISTPSVRLLEKSYSGEPPNSPRSKDLGFYFMKGTRITGNEINTIKHELEKMSNHIRNVPHGNVTKSVILSVINRSLESPIKHLFILDFSCNGYINTRKDELNPLTDDAVGWMNSVFTKHNLRGGIRRMSKKKDLRRKKIQDS